MRVKVGCLALVMGLFWSVAALAAPITYIYTGTGSGTIGTTGFTNAPFTFTCQVDTDDPITDAGGGCSAIEHRATTVEIGGVGTFTITSPLGTFYCGTFMGLWRPAAGNLYTLNGVLSGWDLVSDIGPVNAPGQLMQWVAPPVETSGGVLVFNDASGISGTFQAILAPPVPTLGGWAALLLPVVLLGIMGARLRRRTGTA